MPTLKELHTTLPDTSYEFHLSVKGNLTNLLYEGNFKFQIPNIKRRAEAEKERARLVDNLGKSLEDDTNMLFAMYGYLKHSLVDFPLWFKESDYGMDLLDINVISELYSKCTKFELDWYSKVFGNEEGKQPSK